MKRIGWLLLWAALAALAVSAFAGPASAVSVTTAGHPRWMINADTLEVLRDRWNGSTHPAWTTFLNSARQAARSSYNIQNWGVLATAAAISDDHEFADSLNSWVHARIPSMSSTGQQSRSFFGRNDPVLVYDLCYDKLDAHSRNLLRKRAYAMMKVGGYTGSVVFPHSSELWYIAPYITAGDFGAGGDSSSVVATAIAGTIARAEWWVECFDQVYGPGGWDAYALQAAWIAAWADMVLRNTDYTGPMASWSWLDRIALYNIYQMRSDTKVMRYRGRVDSNQALVLWWGPWAINKNGASWLSKIMGDYANADPADLGGTGIGYYFGNIVLLWNPNPGGAIANDAPRTWVNNTAGRYTWRDSWEIRPGYGADVPLSSQVEVYGGGPVCQAEYYRWSGTWAVRRGTEDLLYPRGKWINSGDQAWVLSTSGANGGLHIIDPSESLGLNGSMNDGGQFAPLDGSYSAHYPMCSNDARYAGWSDSLPTTDGTHELGVVSHLGGCYGSKADSVTRSIKVISDGLLLVQTRAALTDTFVAWENFNLRPRPSLAGDPTLTALRGRWSTGGGIFEADTAAAWYSCESGEASCYIHPVWASTEAKTRIIGGLSVQGLPVRQSFAASSTINYVSADSLQSYDCWLGDETDGMNRPPTVSVTQAWIDDRNSYTASTADHKNLGWQVQTYYPDASGTLRSIHLVEWGGIGQAPRTMTATANGGGIDVAITPGPIVLLHEPLLADSGYAAGTLQALTVAVPAAGECRLWGFEPGNYTVSHGATSLEVSAPYGGIVFAADAAGSWSIVQAGGAVTGACCHADGTCTETTEANCDGTWTSGATCAETTCEQPTGACCRVNGTCILRTQAACNNEWLGMGTVCEPNPCPQPTGSCCSPDGSCVVTLLSECANTWTMFQDCDPNPCVQPWAACCDDEACTYESSVACASHGGTWLGFGTDCDPDPCAVPDPTGSCCYVSGACAVTTEAECAGTSWTEAGVCDPNPCAQPSGACCAHDGTCTLETEADCSGDSWLGYGSICSPNPCQQPTGSCCAPNGACTVTLAGDCSETWEIDGVCSPNPCAQPSGACCDPDGSCTYVAAAACAGSWLGFGTDCDPDPCPDPPPTGSCCYGNGTCAVTVEAACSGDWTEAQGCVPNPCPHAPWWRPINPWDPWSWWAR